MRETAYAHNKHFDMVMKSNAIFALASGSVPAGIAIVRVSGSLAGRALEALSGRILPRPREAKRVWLADPVSGELLDVALAIWFPAPGSFTGENVVEFHLHGGRAVVSGVLSALAGMKGLRPAEPGEFARRAFENGKIDLTEAEGLADLIEAETEAQRRQALNQMQGALGVLYEDWRDKLLRAQAHMETAIDFSDEEIPEELEAGIRKSVQDVAKEIGQHLADKRRGEILRSGVRIAIIGPPNAGKSSLLNLLAQREAAIVSERAGTTRDIIEVHLNLGGYPVMIADTAGLRDGGDEIELEGVRRAQLHAGKADLKLAVFDGKNWPKLDGATLSLVDKNTISAINKSDLKNPGPDPKIQGEKAHAISVKDSTGIKELLAVLGREVEHRCGATGEIAITRARHRHALENCQEALDRLAQVRESELAAEDLRLAVRALGQITGRVGVEDVLDMIFGEFCIGK